MTTTPATHHLGRAVAVASADAPEWRVELRAGAHHLVADEPVANFGGDAGPSPLGYVLCGLAACTAMTLRMYAERKGWDLPTIEVAVRYDVTDGEASIDRSITVPADLPDIQRNRLADVAERTPVTIALRAGTPIATTMRTTTTKGAS